MSDTSGTSSHPERYVTLLFPLLHAAFPSCPLCYGGFATTGSNRATCLYTCVLFIADGELGEHCLSMHRPRNHCHKTKQEAAGDVQLAVNDTSSQWRNNFPIHQSSSAHASLPLFGISLPALLPPLGRNYSDGQGDWLSWTTIWCLFQLRWNRLSLHKPLTQKCVSVQQGF